MSACLTPFSIASWFAIGGASFLVFGLIGVATARRTAGGEGLKVQPVG